MNSLSYWSQRLLKKYPTVPGHTYEYSITKYTTENQILLINNSLWVRSDLGADLEARILRPSKDARLHRFDTKAASFDRFRMLRCPQIRTHSSSKPCHSEQGEESSALCGRDPSLRSG
jgi:hypothetical protein